MPKKNKPKKDAEEALITEKPLGAAETKEHLENKLTAEEYLEGWKRARAELVNYKAQVAARHSEARAELTKFVLTALFPLADNFRSMVTHTPPELQDSSWVQGVTHIAKQLDTVLEDLGAERMELAGEEFDPSKHEAVAEVEVAGVAAGTVVEVTQAGYMMGGQVLRPAKVTVAR